MNASKSARTTAYRRWRARLADRVHTRRGRLMAWLDMMVMDHGFLRPFFNRPCEIAPGVWRSNQPTPGRIRRLKKRGLRTVVNLRGESDRGAWLLEKQACDACGVELIDLDMASRKPPKVDKVERLQAILASAEKPLLIHCKSGADRAGLASALYLMWFEGVPVEQASRQLSLRFLHVRQAQTGVLDAFLEEYQAANAEQPTAFGDWLHGVYDYNALRKGFRPSGWANVLVDKLLRRE
ncbi:MAG: tyrosine-protein phosphatase [Natronospirillum sp.]|uniref:fused DSP-PTPase phosphatase/NAD kinase-like protein n=1 Tax=Natronospirillum sp. TaxID=2812955 RepID=UPI0025D0454C|nr:sulfur transferase domain-containing protein [Natronospirillum sp.]MCH8553482.1 tyrosine-protein phosphatase [Natronospirillum sp.]